MRWWGIRVVALASVVAASCGDGVEVGEAPTTTAVGETTLPTTAPTTTTTAPPRKATTKTTAKAAAPKPTLPPPEEHIEIRPEHVEPFLLDDVSTWFRVPDEHSRKGPLDIERAAADAAGDDREAAAEVRKLLERLDFVAGYSRRWDRADSSRRNVTSVSVALLLFPTQEAGEAYLDFRADVYNDVDGLQEMYVDEAPGAKAWIGGNQEDGYGAVVVCEYEGFFFEIVAESESSVNEEYRRAAKEFLGAQHQRLRAALE